MQAPPPSNGFAKPAGSPGPPPPRQINDLPYSALLHIFAHVPLERNQVENRHALALVCRRWRDALACGSEEASALWTTVEAAVAVDPATAATFPLHGMYQWFSRHAASVRSLVLEISSTEAWAPVHALLGATGATLESLRLFSDSEEACFVPSSDCPWLGLLPRLQSLELEGVVDVSIEFASLPPGLTRVSLGGCGLRGLYRVPPCLTQLPHLRSLGLQFMEPGADLSGLSSLTGLQYVDLSNCSLGYVPEELAALTNLTSLTLNNNEQLGGTGNAERIEQLAHLSSLQCLELRDCALKCIPQSVVGLTSLRTLLVGYNDLTADDVIPQGPYLAGLEVLGISNSMPDPVSLVPALLRPLVAATSLQVLRMNCNWGLALSGPAVSALLKGKPNFRKLEYSEDMAPDLDVQELKRKHPGVNFKVVD